METVVDALRQYEPLNVARTGGWPPIGRLLACRAATRDPCACRRNTRLADRLAAEQQLLARKHGQH